MKNTLLFQKKVAKINNDIKIMIMINNLIDRKV